LEATGSKNEQWINVFLVLLGINVYYGNTAPYRNLYGWCILCFFNNCENNNESDENEYNDAKYSILLHTVSFYNNVLSG